MELYGRVKYRVIMLLISICIINVSTLFAENKEVKSFYIDTVGDAVDYSSTNSLEEALREYMKDSSFFNGYSRIELVTEEEDDIWFNKFDTYNENEAKVSKENIGIEIDNIRQMLGIQHNQHINIIMYIVLLLVVAGLAIFKKKRASLIVLILSIIILGLNMIYIYNINNKKFTNDITEFLDNKNVNSISQTIKNKYNETFINEECDKDWNISYFINDYITKVLYCVECKSNKELPNVKDISKSIKGFKGMPFLFESHRVMTTSGDYCSDQDEYVDGTKYLFDDFGIYSEYTTEESIMKIYNNLTDDDCEDYRNGTFIKKLVSKIDNLINARSINDFRNLSLCDYFGMIYPEMYFLYYGKIENNDSVVFHIKYWYINGESRDIELPYGIKIKYEKPTYENKDIKEIVCNNYDLLDKNIDDKQYIYNYYIDSNNVYNGAFTKVNFITENGKRKAYFNPFDLTKNIKRASIRIADKN